MNEYLLASVHITQFPLLYSLYGRQNPLHAFRRRINGSNVAAGAIGLITIGCFVALLIYGSPWCLAPLTFYVYVGVINLVDDWSELKGHVLKKIWVFFGWPVYTATEGLFRKRKTRTK